LGAGTASCSLIKAKRTPTAVNIACSSKNPINNRGFARITSNVNPDTISKRDNAIDKDTAFFVFFSSIYVLIKNPKRKQ
jgi:hypothetical protein